MIKNFPELYSRDSTGKILTWKIEIRDTLEGVKITSMYGEYYGKKAVSDYLILQGKNLGKSNETTPFEQAILEAESTFKLHQKKGYKSAEDLKINLPNDENYDTSLYHSLDLKLTQYRTDKNEVLKPMLCQQYYRSKKDWIDPYGEVWEDRKYYYLMNPYVKKEKDSIIIKFPCILQPKINGIRCIADISLLDDNINVVMTSKEGNEIKVPHIEAALKKLGKEIFTKFNKASIKLDGELYIHGMLLQDIKSCITKFNLNTYGITYQVFDLAIENNTNIKRVQALNMIKKLLSDDVFSNSPIYIVFSTIVNNDTEVQHDTDTYINMGYEGSILRDPNGLYEFGKRPKCMVKLKRPTYNSFLIVDIIPQEKDPNKGLFVCKTEEGLEFLVTPKGNDEFKILLLATKDLFINKMLYCTFYEYTKDNKPFHIIYNKVKNE